MGNVCGTPKEILIAKINEDAEEIVNKQTHRIQNNEIQNNEIQNNEIQNREIQNREIRIDENNQNMTISGVFKSKECISRKIWYNYLKRSLKEKESEFLIDMNMRTIYLCKKNIIELCCSSQFLNKVKKLQLCCNYLTSLPSEIGSLKCLEVLKLSHNLIYKLPNEIGKLRNLRELNLGYNSLQNLPRTITALENLENLNIQHNLFKELPQFLGKIPRLRMLNISNNKVDSVPVEILNIPTLIEFYYYGCPFTIKSDCKANLSTLSEFCAKRIINHQLPIRSNISQLHINLLLSGKECTFCHSTIFKPIIVYSTVIFFNEEISAFYTLCQDHFRSNSEKIHQMFSKAGLNSRKSIYEILNPYLINIDKGLLNRPCKNRLLPFNSLADQEIIEKLDFSKYFLFHFI